MQLIEVLLDLLGLPFPGSGKTSVDRAERTGCAVATAFLGICAVGGLLAYLLYVWIS